MDEQNGLLVPVDDAAALSIAMEKMAADAEDYDGGQIARTVRERFSPAVVAGELTAIYRELKKNEYPDDNTDVPPAG